jgi:uncharacterized membrane protein
METCSHCGKEMKSEAKFCKSCGTSRASRASFSDKKARITGSENSWQKPMIIAVTIIAVMGVLWLAKGIYMKSKMGNRPMFSSMRDASARLKHASAVQSEGGLVRIPLVTIEDGNAHFFAYTSGSKTVTFFVMKSMDGTIRTAYDACMACNHAKLGYRQEGDLVACNNCGMGFKPEDIGKETGGCNPIPVNKSLDGKMLVFKTSDLEAGTQYF